MNDDLTTDGNEQEDSKEERDLSSEIDYLEYMTEFGLTNLDVEENGHLKGIINWIQNDIQSDDKNEVMMKLSEIEEQLGPVPYGESRISRLRRWISLEEQMKSLEKQKKTLLNSGGY